MTDTTTEALMAHFRRRRLAATLAAVFGLLSVGVFAPAEATHREGHTKPGFFTCSASPLRVTVEGVGTIEPFAANPGTGACEDAQAGLIDNATLGPVTISVLNATTDAQRRGSEAAAEVLHLQAGPVEVTLLSSFATAECQDNPAGKPTARRPLLGGDAQIASIKIDGQEVVPDQLNEPRTVGVPGVITITAVDEERQSSNGRDRGGSITERALVIETAIAEVVVAEARADYHGQPCAPGQTKER